MMYWNDGWAWFWMIPMMLLWVLVLGAVVYAAVRLANRDSHQHEQLDAEYVHVPSAPTRCSFFKLTPSPGSPSFGDEFPV
jgi:hypothetical protein